MVLVALVGGCGATNSASVPRDRSDAPAGAVRYLAIGDSLTQGVGAPDMETGAFPALLAERWRAEGCEVELRNAGISGYTAAQVVSEQLPEIDAFRPTVVTFQAGANDIVGGVTVEEYRAAVETVLDTATASGARVVVLAQNEWFRSPEGQNYGTGLADQRAAFDEVLIEQATARGAQFVDLRSLYTQQADDGLWVSDGIHPTTEAYAAWAAELAGAVPVPCT